MKLLLTFALLFVGSICFATPEPPPPIPPPPGLPVDNGIVMFTVLSVIFAFYKLYLNKKRALK